MRRNRRRPRKASRRSTRGWTRRSAERSPRCTGWASATLRSHGRSDATARRSNGRSSRTRARKATGRRRPRRKRHKRGKSYAGAGRGRIPGRIDIDLRPKSVENRARAGHWEGDLINGLRGTGNLVTVVERMSRFTLVGYSATKETDAVMAVFKALLRDLPQEMVQSLTLDNGKEYAKFKVLVRDCGLDVFFAKPYHS